MRLSETALLISLHIKTWSAEREDKAAGDAVALKYGSDSRMGSYRKYLIDPKSLQAITKLKGKIRTRHYELTLPWNDGARIISNQGYMAYIAEFQQFGAEMDVLADEFANAYPDLVADARASLNGLFRQSEYPMQGQIRGKYSVRYQVYPVPESSDFRCQVGENEKRSIMAQITESNKVQLADAMGDVVSRIRSVVGHMSAKLREFGESSDPRKGNFHSSLVGNVRDLVGLMPSLNLTGDKRINDLCAMMRDGLIGVDADALKQSDVSRDEVKRKADQVLRQIEAMGL